MTDASTEHMKTSKPFPIAGRYTSERERLAGMTDAERAWRAQWLKDQVLSHREPVHVPELEQELVNPIRRFYRAPLNMVESMMKPIVVSDSEIVLSTLSDDVTTTNFAVLGSWIRCRFEIFLW